MRGGSIVPGHLGVGVDGGTGDQHDHPVALGAEDHPLLPIDLLKDPGGHLHDRKRLVARRDRQAAVPDDTDTRRSGQHGELLIGGVAALRGPVVATDLTGALGKICRWRWGGLFRGREVVIQKGLQERGGDRPPLRAVVGDEHPHLLLGQQGQPRVEEGGVAAVDQQALVVQLLLPEAVGHAGQAGIVGELLRMHLFGCGFLQDALGAEAPVL